MNHFTSDQIGTLLVVHVMDKAKEPMSEAEIAEAISALSIRERAEIIHQMLTTLDARG